LADAGYGAESDFRDWLQSRELDYVLGVSPTGILEPPGDRHVGASGRSA
jgi:hypothetical protein